MSENSYLRVGEPLRVNGRWEASWWDAAHQHMVLFKDSIFYLWSSQEAKQGYPGMLFEPRKQILVKEQIVLCKISLDLQLLAVQRSATSIVVYDMRSHQTWNIEIKSPNDNRIIAGGVIWSEHGGGSQDLVLVTTRGLEMWKISPQRSQCKLSRTVSQGYSFHASFWYEPNFRCLLLASPIKSTTSSSRLLRNIITGAGLKSSKGSGAALATLGGLALNGYFFKMTKETLPKLELPPPDKTTKLEIAAGTAEKDLAMLVLYGMLYCSIRVSSGTTAADVLQLYAVSKAALSLTHTHTLQLGGICRSFLTSVTDNLLLVHCAETKSSLVFDILSSSSSDNSDSAPARVIPAVPHASIKADMQWKELHAKRSNEFTATALAAVAEEEEQEVVETRDRNLSYVSKSDAKNADLDVDAEFISMKQALNLSAPAPAPAPAPAEDTFDTDWGEEAARAALEVRLAAAKTHEECINAYGVSNVVACNEVYGKATSGKEALPGGEEGQDNVISLSLSEQKNEAQDREPFVFLAPCWLWDEKANLLWRLLPCLADMVSHIHDPRMCIGLLLRRGQPFLAPRPVYTHANEIRDSVLAKRLLIHAIGCSVERSKSLSYLQAAFLAISRPYGRCAASKLPSASGSPMSAPPSAEFSWNGRGGSSPAAVSAALAMEASSRKGSGTATPEPASPITPGGNRTASLSLPAKSKSGSSDALSSIFAFGSSVSAFMENTQATLVAYAERLLSPAQPADEDSLEPIGILHALLTDITAIGGKRHRHVFGLETFGVENQIEGQGSKPPTFESSISRPIPLVIRRDHLGNLVVTQTELLSHVWLPQLLINRTGVDFEYLGYALMLAQSTLRGCGAETHPATSLCLLKVLGAQNHFIEIGRLLQLQFFPDAPEVAMFALDLCEAIEVAAKTHEESAAAEDSGNEPASEEDTVRKVQLSKWFIGGKTGMFSAMRTLRQAGLDMLWRIGEQPLVIRWMLVHGRATDAMRLCTRYRGQFRAGLPRGCISGVDFFDGVVSAIKTPMVLDEVSLDLMGEGGGGFGGNSSAPSGEVGAPLEMGYIQRVGIFYSVYQFLQDWDPEILTPDAQQPEQSQLAMQSRGGFPLNLFTDKDELRFRKLFGFNFAGEV